ncbi:Sir2 family NAD-dependent protein deacetylase [Hahella ganghwensis]|uniref:Sir2 family NAD-dependent protein deacetylase n=1 Tax=Hahella ganghwensis TaxID=286420 RepID=UPI00037285EF|nr:Sir2 family NAD-dependent protein deacetylase [Hahella ganghwensis]
MPPLPKIAIFTGAGISAESGLRTFRDSENGLWNEHPIHLVASLHGWRKDRQMILDFYNLRRREMAAAEPNAAHLALAALEETFDVTVITQNVDDLHERAGSTQVIHLHGELTKARSCLDHRLVYDIGNNDILMGERCERGSQLRPHIVWFGESILGFREAKIAVREADIILVVGTSLEVYPAASLPEYAKRDAEKHIVALELEQPPSGFTWHQEAASISVPQLVRKWLNQ